MAWPTTPVAVGDLITVANLNALTVKLAEYNDPLGSDPTNINFSSIPSVYAHLMLLVVSRGDSASGGLNEMSIRFNNDSGGNYDEQQCRGVQTAPAGNEGLANTMGRIVVQPMNGAGASMYGCGQIIIPHYAQGNDNKSCEATWAAWYGTATSNVWVGSSSVFWRSNSAINRITLVPNSGTGFKAPTRVNLYGIPG